MAFFKRARNKKIKGIINLLVVIAGAGNVGKYLVESFLAQGEEIVLIEQDLEKIKNIKNNFDVLVIRGDMLSHFVLRSANVQSCDLFIACSNSDSSNILSCQLSKRLGAGHSVARVYSEEIFPQHDGASDLENYLDVDWLVSPSRLAGYKLAYALFDSKNFFFDSYFDAHLDLAQIKISSDDNLLGKKSHKIFSSNSISLLNIFREGKNLTNDENHTFAENDELLLVGKNRKIVNFVLETYPDLRSKINHIYFAGASRAVLSALTLFKERVKYITLIDKDLETCQKVEASYDIKVLNIDPSNFVELNELKLHKEGVFVCASENDAENLTYFLNAEDLRFSQIIPLVNEYDKMRLFKRFHFDQIISLPFLAAQEIFRYFNQYIKKDFELIKGNAARAVTKKIDEKSTWIGKDIKKILANYDELKFVALWRKGLVFIDKDKEIEKIEKDDKIIVTSLTANHKNLEKILITN